VSVTPAHLGGHFGVTHVDAGVLDALIAARGVRSVLDVGCGPGEMLDLAEARGLRALGIDGDPSLAGGRRPIRIHDYSRGPLALGGRFDLAWSVEFLEHVEERYVPNYMATFAAAGLVFCTAAPPGKPGHHHVNCRETAYWERVFGQYGWRLDSELTARVRTASTMSREFVRESGMVFVPAARPGPTQLRDRSGRRGLLSPTLSFDDRAAERRDTEHSGASAPDDEPGPASEPASKGVDHGELH
jgi:SAM-dependent methyltransferase